MTTTGSVKDIVVWNNRQLMRGLLMKTYRILSEDDLGEIDARFESRDELDKWVELILDKGAEYKVIEETWQCVSEVPFIFTKE